MATTIASNARTGQASTWGARAAFATASAYYVVLMDTSGVKLRVYKSTDGTTWTQQDSANAITPTAATAPYSCWIASGVIYIAYYPTTSSIRVGRFNTATDTFSTVVGGGDAVGSGDGNAGASSKQLRVTVRSDGDVLLTYVRSSNSIYWTRYEGSSWAATATFDSSSDDPNDLLIMSSDRAISLEGQDASNDHSYRTVDSANTLGTLSDFDTSVATTVAKAFLGCTFNDGTNDKVGALLADSTGELDFYHGTQGATLGSLTAVSGVNTAGNEPQFTGAAVESFNSKIYACWSKANTILYDSTTSLTTLTFGTDQTLIGSLTDTDPIPQFIKSPTALGVVYNDAGAVKVEWIVAPVSSASRTIPQTAHVLTTNPRTVPQTTHIKVVDRARTVPQTGHIKVSGLTRTVPQTVAVRTTNTRAVPQTVHVKVSDLTRPVPQTVHVKVVDLPRTVPQTAAVLTSLSRSIPQTGHIKVADRARTVPQAAVISRIASDFSDDFGDGTLASFWSKTQLNGGVTTEQNSRLEFQTTTATASRAGASISNIDVLNSSITLLYKPSNDGNAAVDYVYVESTYGFALYYTVNNSTGLATGRVYDQNYSTVNTSSVASDLNDARWVRLRTNATDVFVEHSYDRSSWTVLATYPLSSLGPNAGMAALFEVVTIVTGSARMFWIDSFNITPNTLSRTVPQTTHIQVTDRTQTVPQTASVSVIDQARTIPQTAAIMIPLARTVPQAASISVLGATRTLPQTVHVKVIDQPRTVPQTAAITTSNPRTIPQTASISVAGVTRTVPQTAHVSTSNVTRVVPQTAAILTALSRSIAQTAHILVASSRIVPQTAAILTSNPRTIPQSAAILTALTRTVSQSSAISTPGLTRAIPQTSSISTPSQTRAVPQSAVLQTTIPRAIPQTAIITTAPNRTVPQSAHILVSLSRPVPQSATILVASTRSVPQAAHILTSLSRAFAQSAHILTTNAHIVPQNAVISTSGLTRSISQSAVISVAGTVMRTVPQSAAIAIVNQSRTIPQTAAILTALSRSVSQSSAISTSNNSRVIQQSAVLSVAGMERTVLQTAAIRTTTGRVVPQSVHILTVRAATIPQDAAILVTVQRTIPQSAVIVVISGIAVNFDAQPVSPGGYDGPGTGQAYGAPGPDDTIDSPATVSLFNAGGPATSY